MRLELHQSEIVLEDGRDEPSLYYIKIEAELFGGEDEGEGEDDELIGKASATIFRHECALDRGVSRFDIGDSVDQDTHDAWSAVMDHQTDEIRENLSPHGGGYGHQNVLYIKTMQIAAPHRGRGLGLFMLQRIMQRFGPGCGIAVIEPSPINNEQSRHDEWRERMEWECFSDRKSGTQKLRRHWKQFGFKPVPGSKQRYWYFDMEHDELPENFDVLEPGPADIELE